MKSRAEDEIRALVDIETKCWDTQTIEPFLEIIHPDMVWPWPPSTTDHNPETWEFVMGRFNRERWRMLWNNLFDEHELIHNNRNTVSVKLTDQLDGAFAVVDIDTLWRHKETKKDFLWKGRVCKIYTKMPGGNWLLIAHTGALKY